MRSKTPQTDGWGIMDGYEDARGRWCPVSRRTRAALREAMGAPAGTRDGPAEGTVIALRTGETCRLTQPAEVRLEDGARLRVESELPPDLPIGYHTLRAVGDDSETHLIVHPGRCYRPEDAHRHGVAVQLYALRSRRSWGIGDLGDLRRFRRWSTRELGSRFILLNPLGAPLPVLPQEPSPYIPSSRLYLNPLYLAVEEVPGAAEAHVSLERLVAAGRALNADRFIERDTIFRLKMQALERIYAKFRSAPAFDRYRSEQGETLRSFAVFCALTERYGAGWEKWPARFRHPASPAVQEFARQHARRHRFHEWLQWLLDKQLAGAGHEQALMLDMPIGVNPDGFDAWLWQDALALDASVGAPPDEFNTLGQNWLLPPFIPHRLRAAGYEPFRRTLGAMLRHARGLRIDHVMGLFRLFWIPRGASPRAGGYVRYRAEELLAVLAIESQRAKAVVVGEDLGTVERGVRSRLRQWGVLSYRLLWFESWAPERYPHEALAAVTTHDLFTVAGLWSGKDLEAQAQLGLHPNANGTESIRRRLRRNAGLNKKRTAREAILGAHRLLARAPCRLITAALEDALAVEERPNMPGTSSAQRPNWSIALPKPLEEIQRDGFVRRLFKVIADRTSRSAKRKGLGRDTRSRRKVGELSSE